MVDRVYVAGLPKLRKSLEKLKQDYYDCDSKTDWTTLRIEPLLKHLDTLEKLLSSKKFSRELSRLRKGVGLFHSDLVYFRKNVSELERILQSEKQNSGKRRNKKLRGLREIRKR
jgi:predicted  nucleic acid-binding Zn-ribbon protein